MKVFLISGLVAVALALVGALVAYIVRIVRANKRDPEHKIGFREWWQAHKPSKRRLIQIYAALLFNANIKGFLSGNIYNGPLKNFCVPGLNCYSCPGASGACPLGALQNAFAESGVRAPYYVLGILLLFGLILGRTICGFLCPVGLGQELLYKIKTPKLKKSRVTRVFSYFKYVLLAVFVIAVPLLYGYRGTAIPGFCKYICPAGTFGGALGLLLHPDNASYFAGLGALFTWKFVVMVAVMVACVFIFRFFCRFCCPLGAIYGFFNRISLLGVKLDKQKCTDCGLCISHCKMDVKRVGDHECISCGECIGVCPAKAISFKGSKLFLHPADASPAPEFAEPVRSVMAGPQPQLAETSCSTSSETSCSTSSEAPSAPLGGAPEQSRKGRGRAFWLRVGAWTLALLLLAGALVYYNFIDGRPAPRVRTEFMFSVGRSDGEAGVVSFTVGGGEDYAVPQSGDGTESAPYVLGSFAGKYDVPVGRDAVVCYSFRDYPDTVYTLTSENEELLFSLFSVGGGKRITVAEISGKGTFSLDLSANNMGNGVGDLCYDFTLPLYTREGEFTLSDYRGKPVVINFWATWCGPCVSELPEFERIKEKYGDALEIIAIHSASVTRDVQTFIDLQADLYDASRTWKEYRIFFAQDRGSALDSEIYDLLVADEKHAYPATLIVDGDGIIRFIQPGSVTYEMLEGYIEQILSDAD